METNKKLNFGQKMASIRKAKIDESAKKLYLEQKAMKDKALLDQFPPGLPLEQPITASITLSPIEVTAPVPAPGQQINIVPKTRLDLAIDNLRNQANKIP